MQSRDRFPENQRRMTTLERAKASQTKTLGGELAQDAPSGPGGGWRSAPPTEP